ncbi:MAG: hypothetical protein U1D69_15555 [Polynucleobacter sp.]|jgi:hypothetical protein|nr:hypothetical protein [Polynucleobacter sp.]
MPSGYKRSYFLILFVLATTQLHLFRNVSPAYIVFYLIAFLVSLFLVVESVEGLGVNQKNLIFLVLMLFVLPVISIFPGVLFGFYGDVTEVLVGLSRLLFTLPIYLAVLAVPKEMPVARRIFLFAGVMTLIAALSIPYQVFNGPISWFAESSERSGLARYSSLFGSLTSLGVVVGAGLLAVALTMQSVLLFSIAVCGIVVGSILSLQKAALVNLLVAGVLIFFVRRFSRRQIIFAVLAFFPLFFLVGMLFESEMSAFLSSFRFFDSEGAGSEAVSDDFSVGQSILDRIFELPLVAVDHFGGWALIFGVGPVGASGALGFPEVPTTHNAVFDILLVGGLPYFLFSCAFLVLLFRKFRLAFKGDDARLARVGLFVFFFILLNSVFSSLLVFTPSGAMFVAASLRVIVEIEGSIYSS